MQLEIVSAQAHCFSGKVEIIAVTGGVGELGIYPGHRHITYRLKTRPVKSRTIGRW